jgi:hypothetical protein
MKRSKDMYDKAEQFARDVDRLLAGQPVAESTDDADRADLALVDLLSRAHFVPDPRFESHLRGNLLRQLYEKEAKTVSPIKVFRSLARSALVAGLSAALVLGVALAVSPDVRAAAQGWLARFIEVDSPEELLSVRKERPALPGAETGAGAGIVPEPAGEGPTLQAATSLDGDSDEIMPLGPEANSQAPPVPVPGMQPSRELLSLEEAQANVDFEIRVPAALPEGYSFLGVAPRPESPGDLPDIGIEPPADLPKIEPPQMAMLLFGNAAGDLLTLAEVRRASPAPVEVPLPAGRGSLQEVTVNGQEAQYIEGMWTADGWTSSGHHQLHWQDTEGITYDLISRTLGLEELLPVAESIE